MRAHRRGEELLCVAEHALLRLKLNVLVLCCQCSLVDLLALKPPQVRHSQPVLFSRLQFGQLVGCGFPCSKCLSDTIHTQSAKTIQQTPLLRLVKRTQRLSLRVHQRELRRKLPQNPYRSWLIVDEHPAFAVCDDLPPQQNMVRLGVDPIRLEYRLSSRC